MEARAFVRSHTVRCSLGSLSCSPGATACFCWTSPRLLLSPQRQLALLVLIHDVLQKHKDAQFIISSHSPVLLGYPAGQILPFDDGRIHEVEYEDTPPPAQIVRRFVNDRGAFL